MRRRASSVLAGLALASSLTGCPESSPPARPPRRPARAQRPAELPHAWPPAKGQPFPALELLDIDGRSVQLSSLAGKVLIVEPVGMSSPGSQGYAGGARFGGFRGVTPQAGLLSTDQVLRARGIDPAHPDLVHVQLLFYDMSAAAAPTVADARAWAEHFGLDRHPNTRVLVGDERYVRPETYGIIPGFYLVDRDMKVVGHLAGPSAPDDHDAVLATLEALLGPTGPVFEPPADPASAYPELAELAARTACREDLMAGRFESLEERLAALRAAGRRPGDFALLLDLAVERMPFGIEPERYIAALDAWCEARAGSALARLTRGHFFIIWAWEARGSGYADTVTEDGWRLFSARLLRARADLEQAVALDPKLAPAWARLITVAMGLDLSEDEARPFYEAGLAVDPSYQDLYTRRLKAIMPKWGGAPGAMWQLVKERIEARPDEPALYLLAIEAHFEQDRMTGGAHLRDPEVREVLLTAQAEVTRAYPRATWAWDLAFIVGRKLGDDDLVRAARFGAAEAGDVSSQSHVAWMLMNGAEGARPDPVKGAELAFRAAHQGRPRAMAFLGHMLETGEGMTRDVAAAVSWYRRGAEAGDAICMVRYAAALVEGSQGAPDLAGARRWLERAAASQDEKTAAEARQLLARLPAGEGSAPGR